MYIYIYEALVRMYFRLCLMWFGMFILLFICVSCVFMFVERLHCQQHCLSHVCHVFRKVRLATPMFLFVLTVEGNN